jgi:hypothetical protein
MEKQEYNNLQELTHYESGAVKYPNGDIWIGNWSSFDGLPRVLEPIGTIGLGETFVAVGSVNAPLDVVRAMEEHDIENGDFTDRDDTYFAWELEDGEIVVTCSSWI